MYILIKIEIACDQTKLKFSCVLMVLAKETFFDFQLVYLRKKVNMSVHCDLLS